MHFKNFKNDMEILTKRLKLHITQPNSTDSILKGFVDSNGNLYPITLDTKVLSKVVEFVFMPVIKEFCGEYGYKLEEPLHQNHYPDLTFIDLKTNHKYAVDIKTTYRITTKEFSFERKPYIFKKYKKSYSVSKINDEGEVEKIKSGNIFNHPIEHSDNFSLRIQNVYDNLMSTKPINGMTLGAYTGYFKNRTSSKNILYPYSSYKGHYVIGMIYSREESDDLSVKDISEYETIESPIYDIEMFFIEKYKIATNRPGSGNTKNIGSVKTENDLIHGNGPFSTVEEFDEFWLNYGI